MRYNLKISNHREHVHKLSDVFSGFAAFYSHRSNAIVFDDDVYDTMFVFETAYIKKDAVKASFLIDATKIKELSDIVFRRGGNYVFFDNRVRLVKDEYNGVPENELIDESCIQIRLKFRENDEYSDSIVINNMPFMYYFPNRNVAICTDISHDEECIRIAKTLKDYVVDILNMYGYDEDKTQWQCGYIRRIGDTDRLILEYMADVYGINSSTRKPKKLDYMPRSLAIAHRKKFGIEGYCEAITYMSETGLPSCMDSGEVSSIITGRTHSVSFIDLIDRRTDGPAELDGVWIVSRAIVDMLMNNLGINIDVSDKELMDIGAYSDVVVPTYMVVSKTGMDIMTKIVRHIIDKLYSDMSIEVPDSVDYRSYRNTLGIEEHEFDYIVKFADIVKNIARVEPEDMGKKGLNMILGFDRIRNEEKIISDKGLKADENVANDIRLRVAHKINQRGKSLVYHLFLMTTDNDMTNLSGLSGCTIVGGNVTPNIVMIPKFMVKNRVVYSEYSEVLTDVIADYAIEKLCM